MMVSPQWYYEENLKGKTVDQLKAEVRRLRRKVRQLQKAVDNPDPHRPMICPSPQVQLELYQLYLQKAIEAVMDAQEYLAAVNKP